MRFCHFWGGMGARLSLSWGPSPAWSLTVWRAMILTPADAELTRIGSQFKPGGDQDTFGLKRVFRLPHPVRLYFLFLKCQEYLQCSGEKVLVSFPVQAMIYFYNDESDSDEEQEEETSPSIFCPRRWKVWRKMAWGKGQRQEHKPGMAT
uniref:Protein ripply3 n=1 Tax=Theropithecus gelada TaxID=9565 RepID=A0A8D2EDM3_THEGE